MIKAMYVKNFLKNTKGAVSVYAALFTIVATGAGALAIDVGRMTMLRTEMQNYADAGAMSGAKFLDGMTGARALATDVANNAIAQTSGITNDDLAVNTVTFYSSLDPLTVATTDLNAKFIHVKLGTSNVNYLFAPVIQMLGTSSVGTNQDQSAQAIAGPKPFLCHAPPLMICDFVEATPSADLRDPVNYGRMVVLKEPQGGGSWRPGNFGLLSLPDGSGGAKDIEAALASVTPEECYDIDVETATGSKTNKVKDGINSRFDVTGNPWPDPAPNVINYPRDKNVLDDDTLKLGNGEWDIEGWWPSRHGGAAVPTALQDHDGKQTSRYQTYLYELGESYWRSGNKTVYPIPDGVDLPDDYVEVNPSGTNIPTSPGNPNDNSVDGNPSSTVADNGQARRLMQVAQLQCVSDNVHGNGTYPTHNNYIEFFITEYVPDPPYAAIYGEVVRALTPANLAEFHANVELY